MEIHGVKIEETFAEAFPMSAARVIVTADHPRWVKVASDVMSGYATSVIGCDAEVGVERELAREETPDGRPGAAVLLFAFSRDALAKAVLNRVGQCLMTCPTTACYNGLPIDDRAFPVGGGLRYFGDGRQISKQLGGRRYWRIPVMDGEFVCEDVFGTVKGVAGGNILIVSDDPDRCLEAAEAAVDAARAVPDLILPFPGGVVRSGSKVGSKYKKLRASTNTAYTPTTRGLTALEIAPEVRCVYEIVIDGLSLAAVERGMIAAALAACRPGVLAISAGNYGGKLGPFHLRLRELLTPSRLT